MDLVLVLALVLVLDEGLVLLPRAREKLACARKDVPDRRREEDGGRDGARDTG